MSDPIAAPAPRFVYFDLDDTLLDHRHAERSALADLHASLGAHLGHHALDHVQATYHAHNAPLWADFAAGHLTSADVKRLRSARLLDALGTTGLDAEAFSAAYLDRYAAHWTWTPGARTAFRRVADRRPVGLLTNGFSEQQRGKLARFPDLADRSAAVVISEEVGVMKPSPAVFELARAQASDALGEDLAPADVLYVGDSWTSDVLGATAAGWRAAWFRGDPAARLPPGATVLPDWDALVSSVA